jgi:hypothetical protein
MRRMFLVLVVVFTSWASGLGQTAVKKPAAAPVLPRVVTKIALLNQNGAISPTTLVNLTAKLYRVSAYYEMVSTTSDCSSSIELGFHWTDDTGHVQQHDIGIFECFDLSSSGTSFVVHGAVGTPLTYFVTTNPIDTIQYNLYSTVEQLE